MDVTLQCQYCGKEWEQTNFTNSDMMFLRCIKSGCNDKNIRVRQLDKVKVDYYQGAPPFPEKKEAVKHNDEWPNWGGGY